ncbi:hypothetical protein PRIPAC_76032 [Pristionchus pacificus]|uniref:Uncharacterized protein n=1 Tax=Pristionchus pacificus TaxID=54126 RepID=A0A2A6CSF7_PRIPA|nr:hypothetical protein PRIPAC_76032 [Pristionchus pacificus]|eukprot:PDM81050.1 hypothetical protein PRIPAC_36053 [Pristionchus pacificus]
MRVSTFLPLHSFHQQGASNFLLDSETVEELASALGDITADCVLFRQLVFPEGNALEQILTTSRFGKLLVQLNPSVIKSYPEDRDVRLMVFDEQFLVRYGGRKDASLIVYTDKNQAKSSDARFHLSDTNWSIIAQYKQLFMRTLIYHLEPNWGHIVRVDTRKYAYFAIESLGENPYLMGASFYENWSVEGREAKNRPI